MNLRFERFDASRSLTAQRDLFRRSFPENDGTVVETETHYTWKFRGAPGPRPSYEFAAWSEDGRMLAGYYAAIPYVYRCDGTLRSAGMVCDVMTHPDLRGQGVFTKIGRYSLGELASEGLDFVTGYPIRPEVIPGHLKVGWKVAFELPMHIHVLGTRSLLRTRGLELLAPVGDLVAGASVRAVEAMNRPSSAYASRTVSVDQLLASDGYDTFLDAWMAQGRISLVKSREFLRWRLGAPETTYFVTVVEHGGRLVGVAILRPTTLQGVPAVAVLDLMVLREHVAAVAHLMAGARSLARTERAEVIVAMMSRRHARELAMLRHGFLPSPAVFSLITRPLGDGSGPDYLVDESAWRLMWIDSDDL